MSEQMPVDLSTYTTLWEDTCPNTARDPIERFHGSTIEFCKWCRARRPNGNPTGTPTFVASAHLTESALPAITPSLPAMSGNITLSASLLGQPIPIPGS